MTENRSDRILFGAVWLLIVFAVLYFGAHVLLAAHRGTLAPSSAPPAVIQEDDPRWDCRTMGNRICGPSTTVDEWPDCGPACHDPAAAAAVDAAHRKAGAGYVCWAEDNAQMPEGYEVLCRTA